MDIDEVSEAQRINIGTKIRRLRTKKEMTMEEVARRAGCSRAFLSRVERNESMPSVATLVAISEALDVSPGYFFEDTEAELAVVQRAAERKRFEDRGVTVELVTKDIPIRKIHVALLTIPEGMDTAGKRHKYDDDQCGLCMKGKIRVTTEHRAFDLEEGDSYYLNSGIPHRIVNTGEGDAVVLLISARRSF